MTRQGTLRESAENSEENNLKEKVKNKKKDKDIITVASDSDTIILYDDACVNLACQDST